MQWIVPSEKDNEQRRFGKTALGCRRPVPSQLRPQMRGIRSAGPWPSKMSNDRPAIPIEIRRQVLFEARHHCAVCCNPLPLEQAHIIPWSESHERSVANLVAFCANCRSRADQEKWGVKVLRKYKHDPCILGCKSNAPE